MYVRVTESRFVRITPKDGEVFHLELPAPFLLHSFAIHDWVLEHVFVEVMFVEDGNPDALKGNTINVTSDFGEVYTVVLPESIGREDEDAVNAWVRDTLRRVEDWRFPICS